LTYLLRMAEEARSHEYRRKAAEAREEAAAIPEGDFRRRAFIRIAESYEQLADMVEGLDLDTPSTEH
jgi:hypothetical protein